MQTIDAMFNILLYSCIIKNESVLSAGEADGCVNSEPSSDKESMEIDSEEKEKEGQDEKEESKNKIEEEGKKEDDGIQLQAAMDEGKEKEALIERILKEGPPTGSHQIGLSDTHGTSEHIRFYFLETEWRYFVGVLSCAISRPLLKVPTYPPPQRPSTTNLAFRFTQFTVKQQGSIWEVQALQRVEAEHQARRLLHNLSV